MADAATGWIATMIASVLFGSWFVPIKKFDTADGLFFNWVVGVAVFTVGLIINLIQGCPKFYPIAMLGGALWTTGNLTAVPIIRMVGMGLGMLVWCSSQMVIGWAMGKFGWFGLRPQFMRNEILNYTGVALALASGVLFLFVTPSVEKPKMKKLEEDAESVNDESKVYYVNGQTSIDNCQSGASKNKVHPISDVPSPPKNEAEFLPFLSPLVKRIVGGIACLVAGLFYSTTFVPVSFMLENRNDSTNYPQFFNASSNPMDYLFSYFTGIFVFATLYFVVYSAVMRNRPHMNSQLVLPSLIAGTMWAVAQTGWFIANDNLSEAVTFPILSRLPPLVSVAWGVLVFKEVSGKKNFIILGVAIAVTCVAAVLTGLTNVEL